MDVQQIPEVRERIRTMQRKELTLRAGLKELRAAGSRIRTDDFATLWRDEKRKQNGKP